jgi:hypothetical protein
VSAAKLQALCRNFFAPGGNFPSVQLFVISGAGGLTSRQSVKVFAKPLIWFRPAKPVAQSGEGGADLAVPDVATISF